MLQRTWVRIIVIFVLKSFLVPLVPVLYPFSLKGNLFPFFFPHSQSSFFSFLFNLFSSWYVNSIVFVLFTRQSSKPCFILSSAVKIHQMLTSRPLAQVFLVLSWLDETYPQYVSPEVFLRTQRISWLGINGYKILGSASLPIKYAPWFLSSPTGLETCWDPPDGKYSVPSSNLCQITSSTSGFNIWSPKL